MTDLQNFITMMTKNVDSGGVYQKLTIEGDDVITTVSFFQEGMSDPVCECVNKTNQEVTFMFGTKDGSFTGVMGAIP